MKNPADKEELLKVLDQNGEDTGQMELRSKVHDDELFHNEVRLWIIDKKRKRVLLQKRSPNKRSNPNKYAVCAGHVVKNDTFEQTLKKEAREELGLDISPYPIIPLTSYKITDKNNHCFAHYFYIEAAPKLKDLTMQKEELSELKYFDYSKLKDKIHKNSESFNLSEDEARLFKKLDKIILEDNE